MCTYRGGCVQRVHAYEMRKAVRGNCHVSSSPRARELGREGGRERESPVAVRMLQSNAFAATYDTLKERNRVRLPLRGSMSAGEMFSNYSIRLFTW